MIIFINRFHWIFIIHIDLIDQIFHFRHTNPRNQELCYYIWMKIFVKPPRRMFTTSFYLLFISRILWTLRMLRMSFRSPWEVLDQEGPEVEDQRPREQVNFIIGFITHRLPCRCKKRDFVHSSDQRHVFPS